MSDDFTNSVVVCVIVSLQCKKPLFLNYSFRSFTVEIWSYLVCYYREINIQQLEFSKNNGGVKAILDYKRLNLYLKEVFFQNEDLPFHNSNFLFTFLMSVYLNNS